MQKADFPAVSIYSAPVESAQLNSINFSVTDGTTPVTGVFTFSEDRTGVIYTPDAALVDRVTYTATINTKWIVR